MQAADHEHACLSCRPDMVPAFDRDDPRYHDGEKCRYVRCSLSFDGAPIPPTSMYLLEGAEGWIIVASEAHGGAHSCPCGDYGLCVEVPRFGVVTATHTLVMGDLGDILRRAPIPSAFATQSDIERRAAEYEKFWSWLRSEYGRLRWQGTPA